MPVGNILKAIEKVKARADKAASASSGDFGHSVTDCMEWQVRQLNQIADDVDLLAKALARAVTALGDEASHEHAGGYGKLPDCPACQALTDIDNLLKQEKK